MFSSHYACCPRWLLSLWSPVFTLIYCRVIALDGVQGVEASAPYGSPLCESWKLAEFYFLLLFRNIISLEVPMLGPELTIRHCRSNIWNLLLKQNVWPFAVTTSKSIARPTCFACVKQRMFWTFSKTSRHKFCLLLDYLQIRLAAFPTLLVKHSFFNDKLQQLATFQHLATFLSNKAFVLAH